MNNLKKMYGTSTSVPSNTVVDDTKNPNRVAGGLRAQGVDTFDMLGEDGAVKQIPTHAYVKSLEEQLRQQRSAVNVLERKLNRLDRAHNELQSFVSNKANSN